MKKFNATDPASRKGKTDSWLTPLYIIEGLGNNFDLDPCGFKDHKTAKRIIQLPQCGLKENWTGKVWLNPPYSEWKLWLNKMVLHRNGSVLLFSRTGVMGEYMKDADHVFFLRKRVKFLRPDKIPAKYDPGCDSMILTWGKQDFSRLLGVQIK